MDKKQYSIKEIKMGRYRHFKGKEYELLEIAEHTETGEELAIYRALYGHGIVYARPLDMFLGKVDKDKYPDAEQEYRFEYIDIAFKSVLDLFNDTEKVRGSNELYISRAVFKVTRESTRSV